MKAIAKQTFFDYTQHRLFDVGDEYESDNETNMLRMQNDGLIEIIKKTAKKPQDATQKKAEQSTAKTAKPRQTAKKAEKK